MKADGRRDMRIEDEHGVTTIAEATILDLTRHLAGLSNWDYREVGACLTELCSRLNMDIYAYDTPSDCYEAVCTLLDECMSVDRRFEIDGGTYLICHFVGDEGTSFVVTRWNFNGEVLTYGEESDMEEFIRELI